MDKIFTKRSVAHRFAGRREKVLMNPGDRVGLDFETTVSTPLIRFRRGTAGLSKAATVGPPGAPTFTMSKSPSMSGVAATPKKSCGTLNSR